VLDFRRIVEPGAAALAASRALGDDARRLLEQAHDEVAAAGRPAAHRQADSRFHLTVATLTGSPRTVEAVTSVQAALHEMLLAIPVLEANIKHSDAQHARLVDAVLGGHAEKARTIMQGHCDDTAALLRGLVG
jgi:GntR family transcriptional repressor for pyruvate dehydrogenase complex